MRTYIITIFISFILAFLLIACSPGRKNEAVTGTVSAPTVSTESVAQNVLKKKDESRSIDGTTGKQKTKYQIVSKTYMVYNESMDIAIRYPQISDLGDDDRQSKLNELIKKGAMPGQFVNYTRKSLFTLPIDYKVTWQSDKLLSIQYSGVGYIKGEPHPNSFFYTTNIDIVQVKIVKLKDLVRIDENFAKILRSEDIKTVSPHPGALTGKQIFINYTSFNMIGDTIRRLNDADELDSKGRLPGYYCYFTQNSLGISAATSHAIGDHAEFEIKYEDIAENIKADNKVWRDFFPCTGKQ